MGSCSKPFRLRARLQHRLNPLHVYCRLMPVLGKRKARVFVQLYENLYRRIFSGRLPAHG